MHSHRHPLAASCSVAAMDQANNVFAEGCCRRVICSLEFGEQRCQAVWSKQIASQQPWPLQAGARVSSVHMAVHRMKAAEH